MLRQFAFRFEDRGFLDEGAWADLVLFDPDRRWKVNKENLHYKCGWSPFEGHEFRGFVEATIVSGHLAYENGQFFENKKGERLSFNR